MLISKRLHNCKLCIMPRASMVLGMADWQATASIASTGHPAAAQRLALLKAFNAALCRRRMCRLGWIQLRRRGVPPSAAT